MESLIIFAVIGIISALFGKKKQEQKPAPKPFTATPQRKPIADNPFKNLGDLAKEFKREQQAEMERKRPVLKEKPVAKPVVIAPNTVERPQREVSRDQGVARTSGRLSVHQENKASLNSGKPIVHSILPNTKDELVRAIIFSEILAPPKSKR
ncbi:hypothetical protein MHH81_13110 [Psychrobacillus sp. FSL H8-0484]|uniref:hypothetical protein n=1 Tax=Psychrobacillus sp. FSL H8-0484 TaxID=2921390 RepID=UPI0030F6B1E7